MEPTAPSVALPEPQLCGKKVAITGRFASLAQREVAELIRDFGGQFVALPARSTAWLVVGDGGWPLHEDGRPTQSLLRARQIQAAGYALEILTEEEFLSRLGLDDRRATIHRRYTIAQLSRILDVPCDRIRTWIRAGLIEPVQTVHRLAYFDFQQVISAKMLCEWALKGVSLQRVRDSFEQLRGWLPHVGRPLAQLAILEENGRLLVRLQEGKLAEPSGQLRFDFRSADDTGSLQIGTQTADQWFDEAITREDSGDLPGAITAYRAAIEVEPHDAVLHFNLANVFYALGNLQDALVHFQQATRHDPTYVEAWNNLGSVQAELNQWESAATSLRQALQLVPDYADAHYNLAETLAQLGRTSEARVHWRVYLRIDPHSAWAAEVRNRLESSEAACR
jgi:tetratricopeptide (TPR) repeat protein